MGSSSVTPKGTLTIKNIGGGKFATSDVSTAGLATFKWKRGNVATSLAFSDQTIKSAKTLKDVVATLDYKLANVRGTVINTKYDLGTNKYQVGATWDGILARKPSTVKLWYSNKDNKLAGESTVALTLNQKANVTFNQDRLLTAKYTLNKGEFTYEPSYNFERKAPAVAVTKKAGKSTVKASYDFKSEGAAVEWNRKPLKITVASVVSRSGSVSKPTVSAVFENVYNF